MYAEKIIGKTKLSLTEGDITRQDVDAIVNAANSRLAGGGGVDGAIHRAGGPAIMDQCRKIGGCPTGQAVITTGGNLSAKYVIHTVGPIYRETVRDAELLASCYGQSLGLAAVKGLRTVALPSISTGAYGYPLEEAANVAIQAVTAVIQSNPNAFDEVRFVLFGQDAFNVYQQAVQKII